MLAGCFVLIMRELIMRIFIAGAGGTLGRPVVRLRRALGHELIGLTRLETRRHTLEEQGVHAVIGDALDAAQLRSLVVDTRPEAVVHLLTALPPGGPTRPLQLRPTNQLRTKGTENLIRAAIAAGARRPVAESFVSIYGNPPAGRVMREKEPFAAARSWPA